MSKRKKRPAEVLSEAAIEHWEKVLDGRLFHRETVDSIAEVLGKSYDQETAREIAFHVSDAVGDLGAIVALHMDLQSLSARAVRDALDPAAIAHIANHFLAAAHLTGMPAEDVFEVGVRIPPKRQD